MADPSSSIPMVSVVLCTRDRSGQLRRTLESLCHQTLDRRAFEVVVIDDGSTDDTHEVVRTFASRLPLRASRQRHAGIASARNHGLFLGRGFVVLFLDEEAAEPELLERHLEAHRRFPEMRFAVLGRAVLDAPLAQDPLMQFAMGVAAAPWSNPSAGAGALLGWGHFRGGRSSCKRAFLVHRGIFDSAFRSAGEDAELGYRLSRYGFQVVYEPGAVTRLVEGRTVDELCARMQVEGEANALLAAVHPAPEVQAWTGAAEAVEVWRELGPEYHSIVRSARALDRLARTRHEAGLPLEPAELALLHRAYAAALGASRGRGAMGAVRWEGGQPAVRPLAEGWLAW